MVRCAGRSASDPDDGFKRTPSAQNVDGITMRMRIIDAFKETDTDGSGTVEPVCAFHSRRCGH